MRIQPLLARLWGIIVPPDDLEDLDAKPAAKARRVPVHDMDAATARIEAETKA